MVVSIKRAADGRRQRSQQIIDREVRGQERILAKHLNRHEWEDFCDLDKPRKRTYLKGKTESNDLSKEGG